MNDNPYKAPVDGSESAPKDWLRLAWYILAPPAAGILGVMAVLGIVAIRHIDTNLCACLFVGAPLGFIAGLLFVFKSPWP
jgi:hypothetical protein